MTDQTTLEDKATSGVTFIDGTHQSFETLISQLNDSNGLTCIVTCCDHDQIKKIKSAVKWGSPTVIDDTTYLESGRVYCIPKDLRFSFNGNRIEVGKNYTFHWNDLERNSLNEVYLFNKDFVLLEANHLARQHLKFSSFKTKQLHIYDITTEYSKRSFKDFIEPLASDKIEKLAFTTSHERADHSTYPVKGTLTKVRNSDGNIYLYCAMDISGHQDIQNKIKNQSEHLNALTSNFPSGSISLFDAKLNLLYSGGEAYADFKIDPEKLIGQNAKDFLSFKTYQQLLKAKKEVVSANSYTYEISLMDRSFQNTLKPVYGEKGDFRYYVLTSIENTSLKEQQNKVLVEKNKYASISNALDRSALVVITDKDGFITYVNPAFCKASKYSSTELFGKSQSILNSDYHKDDFWEEMMQVILSGKTWRSEIKNQAKDGNYFWVDTVINPIYDIDGNISGYLNIMYLITERKELEFNLLQITNKFVLASQAAGIGVWTLDFDANEVFWDIQIPGISELGFFKGSLEKWLRFVHPDDRKSTIQKIRKKRLNNTEFELELRLVTKSETMYFINLKASVETADGQNKRAIGLTWDVSKEKQIQLNLEEALKDREMMYKELHHRIKNNLQMVNSLLYVRGTYAKHEELKEFIKEISTKINSISTIHEKLLQFSYMNQLNIQEYLTTLCHNILRIYTSADDHFILDIDIPPELFDVDTALNLGLIVNEILSNTIKYAYPEGGGPITLSLRRKKDQITLKVMDNGIGFIDGSNSSEKSSYGIQLIELFVRQIDGKMKTSHQNGTAYTITFKKPGV